MKFISTGFCINGVLVSPKVPRKRLFVNIASKKEKEQFKKRLER